jgi:L-alanine-DL-glutamate epimerase-like enolase superfamily enzyme
MPWTLRLFEETPAIEDGDIVVPQKPGLGLKFNADAIQHYDIS